MKLTLSELMEPVAQIFIICILLATVPIWIIPWLIYRKVVKHD